MHCFLTADEAQHNPAFFLARGKVQASPESPQRALVLRQALERSGHALTSGRLDEARCIQAIATVHDKDYLDFLESAWRRWQTLPDSTDEVVPNVHPGRNTQYACDTPYCQADHIIAQAGYFQADTACPITSGTWRAALSSVAAAVAATQLVVDGTRAAYALCRPPGHHAYADQAGGFCYLNNSAIAAQTLLDHGADRVAIIDVDVHHGNGTQGIFYARNDVFTLSLHGDPAVYYPFFCGHSIETGSGDGAGFNLNLPLPVKTGDDAYLERLNDALQSIGTFAPDAVVIALGLDASGDDPLAFLDISTQGFARIGETLGRLQRPTVVVQEGGYLSEILGDNLLSFLSGFEAISNRGTT